MAVLRAAEAATDNVTPMAAHQWRDPDPLPEAADPPPFPVDALPTSLRAFVQAVATARQVPVDMPAMLALSAISAALQGKINALADNGKWPEPVCLYTATAMAPAERKSAALQDIYRPLREWEIEAAAADWAEVSRSTSEHDELQKTVESTLSELVKAKSALRAIRTKQTASPDDLRRTMGDVDSYRVAHTEAQLALSEHQVRAQFRLLFDDLTPELAATALDQQGAIAIPSDEGGPIHHLVNPRYTTNKEIDLGIWLKGHSSSELRIDRQNGRSQTIRNPRITFGLAFQPSVLADIGKSKQMHGTGMLARFLYAMPSSMLGKRVTNAPAISEAVTTLYASTSKAIATQAHAQERIVDVPLTPEADELRRAHEEALEPALDEETGKLNGISTWAGKLNGALVRIAACFAAWEAAGIPHEITERHMEAALMLHDYLIAHAFLAYGAMGGVRSTTVEAKILRAIRRKGWEIVDLRELHFACNAVREMDKETVEKHLDELQERGYVKRQVISVRPFKAQWAVNPKLHQGTDL